MPKTLVSGDILTAFAVEIPMPEDQFNALSVDEQQARVAQAIGVTLTSETGMRIDYTEPAE